MKRETLQQCFQNGLLKTVSNATNVHLFAHTQLSVLILFQQTANLQKKLELNQLLEFQAIHSRFKSHQKIVQVVKTVFTFALQSIKHLKERVNNSIFGEWCDTLIACQDDRTLKDTLMPIVAKLTDVRIANSEIKGLLSAARTEYFMMAGMVVANIPLLYFLNKDWYDALMNTTPGKMVLALSAFAIVITALFMFKWTKPVEYKR